MSAEKPSIRHATSDDVDTVADLLAVAFGALRATRWLVPHPTARATVLAGQFRILAAHALNHGQVYLLTDFSAAAVWFDHTRPVPAPPDYDRRLDAACGRYVQRFVDLDTLLDNHHPRQVGHHHLALLGVSPARQGTGRGTALLRTHHRVLDERALPAYLEASSPTSRDLYARHGYQAGAEFHLPDRTPFWPMWRKPATPP
ncbi:GNAT family N-acetyltransferase [Micromonospora sp. DT233]|uniref:GNAT family N-acetyltransferase n=1 Tax=Micromonospora sp. DT233 TaxID=3393432 RepID=UPI003CF869FB